MPKRKPLIDEDGEVRELTLEDFKQFRPASEVLSPSLLAKLGKRPRRPQQASADRRTAKTKEAAMKMLDVQARLEYARAGVAVLRNLFFNFEKKRCAIMNLDER